MQPSRNCHHHHDDDDHDGDDDNDDDDDTVMTWRVELTKQPMKRRMYCADTDGNAYLEYDDKDDSNGNAFDADADAEVDAVADPDSDDEDKDKNDRRNSGGTLRQKFNLNDI